MDSSERRQRIARTQDRLSREARWQKLPKWAQEELRDLTRKLDERTQERDSLRSETPPSNIAVNPRGILGDPDGYLDDGDRIEFSFPDRRGEDRRRTIQVRREGDYLLIHGTDSLTISPSASNVVTIEVDR